MLIGRASREGFGASQEVVESVSRSASLRGALLLIRFYL